MKKKYGFTVLEFLITFTIIGFMAGMLLPSIIMHGRQQEYVTGYSRAINILNNAYGKYYDLTQSPKNIGETGMASGSAIFNNTFKPYMLIRKTGTPTTAMAGCSDSAVYFYTQDKMRYCIDYSSPSDVNSDYGNEYTYGIIYVDVNGDLKPNRLTTNANSPFDTFPIVILKNRFVPGHTGNASASSAAQAVYFNK